MGRSGIGALLREGERLTQRAKHLNARAGRLYLLYLVRRGIRTSAVSSSPPIFFYLNLLFEFKGAWRNDKFREGESLCVNCVSEAPSARVPNEPHAAEYQDGRWPDHSNSSSVMIPSLSASALTAAVILSFQVVISRGSFAVKVNPSCNQVVTANP